MPRTKIGVGSNPDTPIMDMIGEAIDRLFNGEKTGKERQTGWVLMVFPADDSDRCDYLSNGEMKDVISMMERQLAHLRLTLLPVKDGIVYAPKDS